jgi:pimeloyl-ACP methyl ester carboxylesterase
VSGPDRPRVYLVHGLLATSYAHFSSPIRRWRDTAHVVPLDLPGHGRCPRHAELPYYQSCVDYLHGQMATRGPGHVVGASYLGGSVALRACLAAPGAFRSLVLTGYVPQAPHSVVNRWTQSFFTLTEQDPELVQHYERLHGPRWRQTLETVLAEIRDAYPTAVAVTKDMLATLAVPTLVLNGSLKSDERSAAAALPSMSPRIDAGLIPGAGHIPSHEQPELFATLVEHFWQNLDRRQDAARVRDLRPPASADDTARGELERSSP